MDEHASLPVIAILFARRAYRARQGRHGEDDDSRCALSDGRKRKRNSR